MADKKCTNIGFFQQNYFCDLYRVLEPEVHKECCRETKDGILSRRITIEKIDRLKNNRSD